MCVSFSFRECLGYSILFTGYSILSNLTVHAVFDFWFDIVDMIFFGQIDMI